MSMAVVVAVLAGCTSAVSATAPVSHPVSGGTLVVATALDAAPAPIFQSLQRNDPWAADVFEPIIQLGPDGQPKGLLAKSWKVAANGLSIDIQLRNDVTFQTGRPMTAADVKFSIETSELPSSGNNLAFVPKQFTSINVVSNTELSITFANPIGSLFDYFDATPIVDQKTFAGLADGSQVVGTGPYKFGEWKPGASFTLTRYKGYWGKAPYLASIQFVVTTDATAETSAVRSGRAQVAFGLTASGAATFSTTKQYKVLDGAGTIYPLGLNVTVPPLNDKSVRQAIAYALDQDRVNKQVFAGTGLVTDLMWSPNTPGYTKALANSYPYNLALATKMIKDAGATGAKIPIAYGANPTVRSEYEIVANNLTAIGLVPVPVAMDQPTYQTNQAAGTLGAAFLPLHGVVGQSPATILAGLPTLRKGNPSQFWTQKYQDLTNNVETATTEKAEAAAVTAISKYMTDEAFLLPIIQAPAPVVVAKGVSGVTTTFSGQLELNRAWLAG
jgi:peptide/nickel transport system substrate-binding protein